MAFTLRKRGKHWHARGSVPVRQADGTIAFVRHEESTRETSKTRARRIATDVWQYYHEQAYRPKPKSISFSEAALTYVETKNPSKRDRDFAAKLVAHFGETPIEEIDQAKLSAAAHALYPGCKASTHIRAVFAPAVNILRLSGLRPDYQRPRQTKTAIAIPPDEWFDRALNASPPALAALIVFLTLTGRRITEALEAIDNGDGTTTISKTKSGSPISLIIPEHCNNLLGLGANSKNAGQRLFPYGDRHNVYRELRKACKRAGVPYYGTHAIGRHSFATRLLREGKSLKFVQEAGGWASIKMPAMHYAHLEKSEIQEQVKEGQERWSKKRNTP